MNKISVIITGGGSSKRFGENKLLFFLNGKELILNTIEKFVEFASEIVIPTSDDVKSVVGKAFPNVKFVPSGVNRQSSVLNALKACEYKDFVLIHDGARPFITPEVIKKTIENVKVKRAVVVGVKAIDTVKICDDKGEIIDTPARSSVFYAQTPQAFDFETILNAHLKFEQELENFTDDASLIEKTGQKVFMVEGNYENKKITYRRDLL